MNHKTLEQMADEAGMTQTANGLVYRSGGIDGCTREDLVDFAALVAERCAEICDESAERIVACEAAEDAAERIRAEFPKP